MNSDLTFDLIEKLIAVAIIFQTLELIAIRQVFSDEGVWRWSTLSKEFKVFSRVSQCVFTFFLGYRNFCILLFARLILALTLFFVSSPLVLVSLLISTILISLRWRGTFNGGSDYVTVLVLYSLTFASFFRDHLTVENAVLWYITIQISSSYFI